MSMNDPGWDGGLTPPLPKKPGGVDKRLLSRIGAGVTVAAVVIALVLTLGHKSHHPAAAGTSPTTTAATAASVATSAPVTSAATAGGSSGTAATATSAAPAGGGASSTSGSAGSAGSAGGSGASAGGSAGPTIPLLGISVSSSAAPVTDAGTPVTIVVAKTGQKLPISGVTVESVTAKLPAGEGGKATPAATIGLRKGDVIWGIAGTASPIYTELSSGQVLSTFMRNWATAGRTGQLYLYYYDPVAGVNYASDPVLFAFAEVPGSPGSIDCTSKAGC
jgi:hypothetical protein